MKICRKIKKKAITNLEKSFGTEPYNCKGISEADAKKILKTFKKRIKSDDPEIDETNFSI